MNPENPTPREAEPKPDPQSYYFSEKGSIWSPVMKVGEIKNTSGETTKYILGDPNNPAKSYEVPAAWFDSVGNELAIRDGEGWSVAGKPTLEMASAPETAGASREVAEQAEIPQEVREDLGRGALEAIGVNQPAEREGTSSEKALVDQINQLREGLSERDSRALHQYSTALYGHEETAARQKMSLELQADKQRLLKARELSRKLSDLRESNR